MGGEAIDQRDGIEAAVIALPSSVKFTATLWAFVIGNQSLY
jgi:hypothetical protein